MSLDILHVYKSLNEWIFKIEIYVLGAYCVLWES